MRIINEKLDDIDKRWWVDQMDDSTYQNINGVDTYYIMFNDNSDITFFVQNGKITSMKTTDGLALKFSKLISEQDLEWLKSNLRLYEKMIINEVSDTIKALAKKAGKEKEAEKLWKKAVKIAEDERGKKEKDFNDKDFAYAIGVFKNMLGMKENRLDFKKGDYISIDLKDKSDSMRVQHDEGYISSIDQTSDEGLRIYIKDDLSQGLSKERGAYYSKYFDFKLMKSYREQIDMIKKGQSFLECDTDARSWLETQFPKEEDEIEETMVSGSATSVGLPSKPMKIEVEEDERDDRDLIVDDREPLDK